MLLNFNAPVGYSKKPLNSALSTIKTPESWVELPKSGAFSLEQLPTDVVLLILRFTGQLDVLNLACTSSTMANLCLCRIHDTIIVDSSYTPFNKEHSLGATYVNLLFYFKKLLRTYNGKYAIRKFSVVDLPDLFNVYDAELNNLIKLFLARLNHLNELVWLLDGFRLEHLMQLSEHNLSRIDVKVYTSSHPSETKRRILKADFPDLKALSLSPIPTLRKLAELLKEFLSSHSTKLDALALSRYNSKLASFVPTAEELSSLDESVDTTHRADLETDSLTTIFETMRPDVYGSLTQLTLEHMLVSFKDAELLRASVNMTQISLLRLSNISEYEIEESRLQEHGFLGRLGPLLVKLEHLQLDFRETQRDTIGPFLRCVNSLSSLDLVVRMNEVKKSHINLEAVYLQYIAALQKHSFLRKLSLEFREESQNCDAVENAPLHFIDNLKCFSQLSSLRISSGNEHHKQRLVDLLRHLSKLRVLDDYGTHAGGAPNLGLGMVHPNVFDEWFKVQHVAFLYQQAQCQLQYVRIKKRIFEFEDGTVNPRVGIDRWFENRVRVLNNNCVPKGE
ncbi:hypothetical protein PUMCH_005146 [Australozyma saopauloensis]|uniref:F-box domain-containing protein n=1 Tax=Australozyma saopauloensis TaxID=291208 RepID=A0AAX4HHM9_9ASCO|nr:hypothetical protein PUMCH_005146 [[Candida] saopauloensis]